MYVVYSIETPFVALCNRCMNCRKARFIYPKKDKRGENKAAFHATSLLLLYQVSFLVPILGAGIKAG